MDGQALLQYLQEVLALERQRYTMQRASTRIAEEFCALGHRQHIDKPEMCKPKPDPFMLIPGSISCLVALFWIWLLVSGSFRGTALTIFLILMYTASSIAIVCSAISEWRKRVEDYDYAQVQYRRALYKDDNRVTQERARIPGLQQDYTALQCLLHDTEKALQDLYSLNVVYPAYRGLVPVSMFVQYLASGRCTQLEGHEGCYNLYDSELRQNSIISNLDGIIQKLGELKEAQYELQQAILQSNQDIQRLCDRQLEAYQQHEAIAQYQRQQIADNQRAMERYTFYRDMLTS